MSYKSEPWILDGPTISAEELFAANRRHDLEHGPLLDFASKRCRTCNIGNNIVGHELTDKKISQYEAMGYYTPEFRKARMELARKNHQRKRSGNFDLVDGRMVYRPV